MKESYINEQLLNGNLTLDPKDLTDDIDIIIRNRLKEQVEGICFEDGYVIPDSVKIIKRKIGKVVTTNNKSGIVYNIEYKAKDICPSEGDIIDIYVNNVNKMGVIGYIRLNEDTDRTIDGSPLIIMIPQEYFLNTTYNIDDININQKLTISVIGSRVKFNSDKINHIYSISMLCFLIFTIVFELYVGFERGYVTWDQGLILIFFISVNLMNIDYWKGYFSKD